MTELTQDMVFESAEKSAAKLKPVDSKISDALHGVTQIKRLYPMKQRIGAVYRAVGIIAPLVAAISACKEGCSHCCKMAVGVTGYEANEIAKFLGVEREHPGVDLDRDAHVAKWANVPCPFLKDDRCSVYSVRPLACRTHFNLSAYGEACDMQAHPGMEIPNLNWQPVWFHGVDIMFPVEPEIADIRDFFPHGPY